MTDGPILGDFKALENGRLEGWCWAVGRPRERVVVEITVDGIVVAAITAARMDIDLRESGVGDGYHGFNLAAPRLAPTDNPVTVIEARERLSRIVFGRVVVRHGTWDAGDDARLTTLSAAVAGAFSRLDDVPPEAEASPFGGALNDLGLLLKGIARSPEQAPPRPWPRGAEHQAIVIGRQRLAARRPLTLPWLADPSVSVIVPAARTWSATYDWIQRAVPVLSAAGSEIVLIDDGADPVTALLGLQIRGLAYVRHDGPATASAARNAARASARGRFLWFADDMRDPAAALLLQGAKLAMAERNGAERNGAEANGATANRATANWATANRATVVIGSSAAAVARGLGYRVPSPLDGGRGFGGASVLTPGAILDDAGGFDPSIEDPILAAADFALKAALLGAGITGGAGVEHPSRLPVIRASESFPDFEARWGAWRETG